MPKDEARSERERTMTDAERFVKERMPRAECDGPVTMYWPGQGERKGRFIVVASPVMSRPEGIGLSEVEAWADAANRIEAREHWEARKPWWGPDGQWHTRDDAALKGDRNVEQSGTE